MCDKEYANKSIVYAITNERYKALYVGIATKGFESRYKGGTHNAVNAAIDESNNSIIVAKERNPRTVEKELIYFLQPKWNERDKNPRKPPKKTFEHETSELKKFSDKRPEPRGD